jgi:hypothetical protein
MQYKKLEGGKYTELENKNVDTGFGLDRLLLFLNGLDDGYKTDLFLGAIEHLEKVSGKAYGANFFCQVILQSPLKCDRIIKKIGGCRNNFSLWRQNEKSLFIGNLAHDGKRI